VSINISAPGIVDSSVLDALLSLKPYLARYKLVLEISETSLITQLAQASANLERLRTAGFLVALDDFGDGYSSLGYLASMPVDLVKFDISMTRRLLGNTRQSIIVANLARTVRDAGYGVVAEGIERQEELDKVIQVAFTHGQGYLLGRPAPLKACEDMKKRRECNGTMPLTPYPIAR
jgi:EAL domain-containing protein (putative c-di-GMP-specific phosphodiesterase class I)